VVRIARLLLLLVIAVTAAGFGPDRVGFRIRTLTSGPRHHFFGYYGITPWNRSGTKLVCLQTDFQDHLPSPDEAASICLVDPASGATRVIGSTHAWNFQQGAMLHWNPLKPEDEILFNERRDGEIVTALLDVNTGYRRIISRAINAVSHSGRYALGLTYGRLTRMRPVVGYVGLSDPNPDDPHPDNDGVFLIDLKTGASTLVVSISTVFRQLVETHPELKDRHMWINHTVFNRDDTRFFFLARCWKTEGGKKQLESAMFTANLDGSDLREVVPFGKGVSHFEWRNAREIMATFRLNGEEMRHVLFTDGGSDFRSIGEGFLRGDGHCSFAPDGNWLVTDRNDSKTGSKSLLLYDMKSRTGLELGNFPMGEYLGGDLRCDLHPRWNRKGTVICFDALETATWTRQLHVAELEFRR